MACGISGVSVLLIACLGSSILLLLCVLTCAAVMGQDSERNTHVQTSKPSEVRYTGVYANHQYGFALRVPVGLVALGDAPPLPNHGITIDLRETSHNRPSAEEQEGHIWVDGHYSPDPALNKLTDIVTSELESAQARRPDFVLLAKESSKLGGLDASHIVMKYTMHDSDTPLIEDRIVAIRPGPKGEVPVVYEIVLLTSETYRQKDLLVLNNVLNGFRVLQFE